LNRERIVPLLNLRQDLYHYVFVVLQTAMVSRVRSNWKDEHL